MKVKVFGIKYNKSQTGESLLEIFGIFLVFLVIFVLLVFLVFLLIFGFF